MTLTPEEYLERMIKIRQMSIDKPAAYRELGWEATAGYMREQGFEEGVKEFEQHVQWG